LSGGTSMKAAVVMAAGAAPIYCDFERPVVQAGEELISVRASALSNFSKSRVEGSHYSADGGFPLIAGADGVGLTQDGRRVYFVMPEAPFGALAELCPVSSRRCIELPLSLDDITAAAIANPGMSAWAALVERAHLVPGETVLINGATGTAGRLAVQLAKYLGAARVIATGRNVEKLEQVKQLGADVVIPFTLGTLYPSGAKDYEEALKQLFAAGVDVVVDYLWGESAQTVITAIAKSVDDGIAVRFVHVGGASREENIALPGAALRAAAITLMGSGMGSVRPSALLKAINSVFQAVQPAGLKIATRVVPLSEVEQVWGKAAGRPRLVFSVE
jgi:NADPH:quinone reductase-like Zn-dependent oxidoreductase